MRTRKGDIAARVVLATFRANGLPTAAADVLAADEGLTSARWQVLGAQALAGQPLTAPQVARPERLTRLGGDGRGGPARVRPRRAGRPWSTWLGTRASA